MASEPTALSLIFLVTISVCYSTFYWSVIGVFETKEDRYQNLFTFLKVFSIFFWLLSLYMTLKTPDLSSSRLAIGIFLNLCSLSIFWWASKSIKNQNFATIYGKDVPLKVFKGGPFKYVRNPFYSSYILCYSSTTFTLNSMTLLVLLMTLTLAYLVAVKIEENKFMYSKDFRNYLSYKKNTGRFIPKVSLLLKKEREDL